MTRSPSATIVGRLVFVFLIVATVGAFFITQRLQERPPPNDFVSFTPASSQHNTVSLSFSLDRPDKVTLLIVDENGQPIRRLENGQPLGPGSHSVVWDGRADDGRIARPGTYSLRIELLSEGQFVTAHTRPIVRS
jgi:hypothetical protein